MSASVAAAGAVAPLAAAGCAAVAMFCMSLLCVAGSRCTVPSVAGAEAPLPR